MNEQWKTFLESRAARIGDDGVARFEGRGQASDCALFDLSHLGLIAAEGEDAEAFLQGQLTGDLRAVTANRSLPSSYCSPKGRMLASFRVFRMDQSICLQLPLELLEPTLKRLRMFVLRSRVTLRDVSDEQLRIGIAGDCAPELLARHLGETPAAPNQVVQDEGITCIRLPGDPPRFECIGPVGRIQGLWEALEGAASPADPGHWALLDIRAGIPTVLGTTSEAFVPQMANMQLIEGVSFKKGCYTGQEIVARMQYLGKLKRRMYLAHVETAQAPAPGDALFSPGSASEQGAGRVVDAQSTPEGGYDLLAVVEIASAEGGDVRLGATDGPRIELRPLPYAFEGG